jgi:hypothetical protein
MQCLIASGFKIQLKKCLNIQKSVLKNQYKLSWLPNEPDLMGWSVLICPFWSMNNHFSDRYWWLTPLILTTEVAEIRRIVV